MNVLEPIDRVSDNFKGDIVRYGPNRVVTICAEDIHGKTSSMARRLVTNL